MALRIKDPEGLSDDAILSLLYHDDPAVKAQARAERERRGRAAWREGEAALVEDHQPTS